MHNYRYSHLLLFQMFSIAPLVCVSKSYGLRLPREFSLLMKQLLYLDRYSRLLAPNLNMLQDQRISIVSNWRSKYGNSFKWTLFILSPRWKALFSFLFYIYIYMKINTPQLELNIQEEYRQSKRDMYSFYSRCYTWFSSNGTFDISAVWAFGYPWCCCCTLDLMIVLTFIVSLALV